MKETKKPWEKWSVQKSTTVQFPEQSLYMTLENTVKKYPSQTAIIFEDEHTSYESLKKQVDYLAGQWKSMGIEKGSRIGLMIGNHPYYIVSYYAAHALGLIVVQVNPMYTPRELMQIVVDSDMEYLIFDRRASKTVQEVEKSYNFKGCFTIEKESEQYPTIDSLIAKNQPLKEIVEINPREDVAVIQYTGGTTGTMKGAMLTHYNLVSNVVQSYEMYGGEMKKGEEVVLTATPLYHVYAMTSGMNLAIHLGSTILLFAKFDIEYILRQFEKYRPTFFPGVPKMYNMFINYPNIEQYDLTSLKYCSCGSAPLPVEVLKRFEDLTGATIGEGFGLSEASPSTHRNPPFAARKVGSVGIPLLDTDCLIVDENSNELVPNSVGELLIKGPQVMKGYWNNEEETNKALQNGWLYTGDLAMMDEDGYFYIVGRKKEMMIIGGFNIYPQEIESVLYEHPDIKEAAVTSIPSTDLEETVKAYIVPKEGATIDLEEVKGYCYSKLTPYKVPKEFEVIEELPRNTVGKILKRVLVDEEMKKKEMASGQESTQY